MKIMRIIGLVAILLMAVLNVQAEKKGEKTVVFNANLHCISCKAKVEKNIPYEKGVKNLKVDMEKQTISITFREDKNTVENLRKAIEKLNIEVKETPKTKAASASQKEACTEVKEDCCKKKECDGTFKEKK